VTLSRLTCRLHVNEIRTTLTGHTVSIAKYFVTNVPEITDPAYQYFHGYSSWSYDNSATACHNLTTEGNPSTWRSTWGVNRLYQHQTPPPDYYENSDPEPCTLHPLYCAPTDGVRSFLMLSLLIDGTEYFYKVTLPAMLAGYAYYIDTITVGRQGSTDPLNPEMINLGVNRGQYGWSSGAVYGEGF